MATKKKTVAQIRHEKESEFLDWMVQEYAPDLVNRNHKTATRNAAKAVATQQMFLAEVSKAIESIRGKYTPATIQSKVLTEKETEKALVLTLSDLHYGAFLDPREVPLAYGHVEEARRTAAVVHRVATHRTPAERKKMALHVNLAGDIIQNQLHDPRDGKPLAEQFAAAVHLLAQGLTHLAGSGYGSMTVHCTSGNHGRNAARHPQRATNQKWDSIETMLYYSLSVALAHLPNVKFSLPYRPFVTYSLLGHNFFVTHGDTVIKPGFPGSNIDVGGVRKQINEINAARLDNQQYNVFICGHVHTSSRTKIRDNTYFITNGCLIPTDAYAISVGYFDTPTCQTMFEVTRQHAVGNFCDIDVGVDNDKDKALDKIIKPFGGLS